MEELIKYFISNGRDREDAKMSARMFCGEMWAILDDPDIDPDTQGAELVSLCEDYGVPDDLMYSVM